MGVRIQPACAVSKHEHATCVPGVSCARAWRGGEKHLRLERLRYRLGDVHVLRLLRREMGGALPQRRRRRVLRARHLRRAERSGANQGAKARAMACLVACKGASNGVRVQWRKANKGAKARALRFGACSGASKGRAVVCIHLAGWSRVGFPTRPSLHWAMRARARARAAVSPPPRPPPRSARPLRARHASPRPSSRAPPPRDSPALSHAREAPGAARAPRPRTRAARRAAGLAR